MSTMRDVPNRVYASKADSVSEKCIDSIIKANPTEEATDTLNKLQVKDTIYGIDSGTEVEANVQLVGDEPNLSSIQIDDTKYKVSQVSPSTSQTYDEEIDKIKIDGTIYKVGGVKLYRHRLTCVVSYTNTGTNEKWGGQLIFDIINNDSTSINRSALISYINNFKGKSVYCLGRVAYTDTNGDVHKWEVRGIYVNNNGFPWQVITYEGYDLYASTDSFVTSCSTYSGSGLQESYIANYGVLDSVIEII